MQKPKLSFWQIWNLSFGFLGVQIGYSLQNSNTSSIFQSLGADMNSLSYFWLAAPIAGLIIQPIVGMFSDKTWTRFGRRIPFILGGAIVSTIALMLMPNCPVLLSFAPLAMGAFLLLFMDSSFNVTMQPFRALVGDMLDDSQKTKGFAIQTLLVNIGAIIGGVLPTIMTACGVSDDEIPGQVPKHIAYSYYAGGAILLLTVLVTTFMVKEYPPKEFAMYNNIEEEVADEPKQSFWQLLKNVPKVMIQLGITQFFSWAALFLMWTYLKPAIEGVVCNPAGEVLSAGATQSWVGMLNAAYPIPACVMAIFMTKIASRLGNKLTYAFCLLCGAAGYFCLTQISNQYWMLLPMVGIGIAWAGILAMPYSILTKSVDVRRMGVYMGIFNFTITIPQIIVGLTGGMILSHVFGKEPSGMILLAGIFMLCAAVSVYFVKEKQS
jgi:maltose/moltooligosaccharide transporter